MVSTNSLITRLAIDYPQFSFKLSDTFRWSANLRTIFIDSKTPDASVYSLHELGHAILGHREYSRDIDLIKIERDAWEYAKHNLANQYDITIEEAFIQNNLDTYRDWLHDRSTCPKCHATGLQIQAKQYKCVACGQLWRVNEARICGLKRYTQINNK